MSYRVTFSSGNNYAVKYDTQNAYKTNVGFGISIMPQSLNELSDVELSGNNYDQYVLVYDAASGRWRDRNPDEVLYGATVQPDANRTTYTLPVEFEDKLDVDLDNKIDLDAGTF